MPVQVARRRANSRRRSRLGRREKQRRTVNFYGELARGTTIRLLPLALQRQLLHPTLYIRTIEIRALTLNDTCRVFNLPIGFTHLRPFKLCDENVFSGGDKHTNTANYM